MGNWIGWTAGLVLFDIILIMMVLSFGQAGHVVGTQQYSTNVTQFNSSQTIGWDALNWFQQFRVSFSGLPWWVNLFLIVYNIALVSILVAALVRGFS